MSWNSCYYMSSTGKLNFQKHVSEISRVLKKKGKFIASIPKKTSFIYKNSREIKKGYRVIKNDYFNVRDGEIFRCFSSRTDLKNAFKSKFENLKISNENTDWFGLNYHWYILVAEKK